ncbi:MAG: zinc-dependent alcohol dehydrogenase family protein [Gemmatimonadota bacterium]
MRAMVLRSQRSPLGLEERTPAEPGPGEVRVRVRACGVCRTDLHVVDGDLTDPALPVVPGHEIVGEVEALGEGVQGLEAGQRVGVPWLGWTCGECRHCSHGRENLCVRARFTGYHRDGGFADYTVADARYVFPLPPGPSDVHAAPLLCAGLIGYRSYRMAAESTDELGRLGLYGFGAAAHLIAQVAVHDGRQVYAFTRAGDQPGQAFARSLGAAWAGASTEAPPEPLDAAIIFAPVGPLVPLALRAVRDAGAVVCAGIHMSPVPAFPYAALWGERVLRSVANLERRDGEEFLELAGRITLRSVVHPYPLESANQALDDLRAGRFEGAAVLEVG